MKLINIGFGNMISADRVQSLLWTATTLCCLRFCRRPFREEWTAAVQRRKKSMSEKGILFVLTGPSGVGKGTVLKEVRAHKPLFYSISATTRAPRAGEQDGVHYHFMTRETFRQLAEQDGTPAAPVDEELQAGRDVLLEIEVQGAMQVKDIRPEAVRIFLAPPSFEELERRLIGRGTEEPEVIQRRLDTAKHELTLAPEFDYIVINNTVEQAVSDVLAIMQAEACRSSRVTLK